MRGLEKYTSFSSAKGFTILELMMVMVILAVLLSLSAPSVRSMIDKQRVRGTCESIYQNLALARSSAVSLNQNVTFNFRNPGKSWCLGVYDASATTCNCGSTSLISACKINGVQRTATYYDFGGGTGNNTSAGTINVSVTPSVASTSIVFDARDATPDATADFSVTSDFWACKIKLEALGQVKYYKSGKGNRYIVPAAEAAGLTN